MYCANSKQISAGCNKCTFCKHACSHPFFATRHFAQVLHTTQHSNSRQPRVRLRHCKTYDLASSLVSVCSLLFSTAVANKYKSVWNSLVFCLSLGYQVIFILLRQHSLQSLDCCWCFSTYILTKQKNRTIHQLNKMRLIALLTHYKTQLSHTYLTWNKTKIVLLCLCTITSALVEINPQVTE